MLNKPKRDKNQYYKSTPLINRGRQKSRKRETKNRHSKHKTNKIIDSNLTIPTITLDLNNLTVQFKGRDYQIGLKSKNQLQAAYKKHTLNIKKYKNMLK